MGYKMLIIEDEVMIRKGLTCITDWVSLGISSIREAENGEEGIAAIKEFQPDIVITDINMPVKTGLQVLEETLTDYHYIPIIISGYSDFEYAQKAIEFGVTAFLLKPIDLEKLVEAVEKAKVQLHHQSILNTVDDSRRDYINVDLNLLAGDKSTNEIVNQMLEYIRLHYAEKVTLGIMTKTIHYSENFMLRKFKEETQMNFSEYLTRYRLTKAIELIREKKYKLQEIGTLCGFSEYKYFRLVFQRYVGCTPRQFLEMLEDDSFFLK